MTSAAIKFSSSVMSCAAAMEARHPMISNNDGKQETQQQQQQYLVHVIV